MDMQPGSYSTAAKGKPQKENLNDEAMAARLGKACTKQEDAQSTGSPVAGMDRQPGTYRYDINKQDFVPNIDKSEANNES